MRGSFADAVEVIRRASTRDEPVTSVVLRIARDGGPLVYSIADAGETSLDLARVLEMQATSMVNTVEMREGRK